MGSDVKRIVDRPDLWRSFREALPEIFDDRNELLLAFSDSHTTAIMSLVDRRRESEAARYGLARLVVNHGDRFEAGDLDFLQRGMRRFRIDAAGFAHAPPPIAVRIHHDPAMVLRKKGKTTTQLAESDVRQRARAVIATAREGAFVQSRGAAHREAIARVQRQWGDYYESLGLTTVPPHVWTKVTQRFSRKMAVYVPSAELSDDVVRDAAVVVYAEMQRLYSKQDISPSRCSRAIDKLSADEIEELYGQFSPQIVCKALSSRDPFSASAQYRRNYELVVQFFSRRPEVLEWLETQGAAELVREPRVDFKRTARTFANYSCAAVNEMEALEVARRCLLVYLKVMKHVTDAGHAEIAHSVALNTCHARRVDPAIEAAMKMVERHRQGSWPQSGRRKKGGGGDGGGGNVPPQNSTPVIPSPAVPPAIAGAAAFIGVQGVMVHL